MFIRETICGIYAILSFDVSLPLFTFHFPLCSWHFGNGNASITNPSAATVATFHPQQTYDFLCFTNGFDDFPETVPFPTTVPSAVGTTWE